MLVSYGASEGIFVFIIHGLLTSGGGGGGVLVLSRRPRGAIILYYALARDNSVWRVSWSNPVYIII